MALTKDQRAALEAAGYTIAKSGKTIKGKDGGTIGGINENGKFFSGSKKVMDILKNPPKAEAKPAPKPAKKDDKKAINAVRPAPGGPGKLPAAPRNAVRPTPGGPGSLPAAGKPKTPARQTTGGARPEGPASGMPANAAPRKGFLERLGLYQRFKNREGAGMAKGGMVKKPASSTKPPKTYKK